jgi:hypothetical protein
MIFIIASTIASSRQAFPKAVQAAERALAPIIHARLEQRFEHRRSNTTDERGAKSSIARRVCDDDETQF